MFLPQLNLSELLFNPSLNDCVCGSDDIAIVQTSTLGIQNYTILKCNKCGREIKRRTYRKAEKAWNKNNPKKGGEG